MKHIIYTQRVEVIENYGERRDAADQNVAKFLRSCGFLPFPIMNISEIVDAFCEAVRADGIFLSGGNDLASYGGNAPERDETERKLVEYAIKKDIPLFGICRGMQFVLDYFGTKLEKIENHVRRDHAVSGIINRDVVNTFHTMGAIHASPPMEILAKSDDGVVEAVRHSRYKIAGVMWHPERTPGFLVDDINMVKRFYEEGKLA